MPLLFYYIIYTLNQKLERRNFDYYTVRQIMYFYSNRYLLNNINNNNNNELYCNADKQYFIKVDFLFLFAFGYSDFRFETLKKVSTSVVLQIIG